MVTSVQQYLDSTFRSSTDLVAKADDEAAKLKSYKEEIDRQIEHHNRQLDDTASARLADFQGYLDTIKSSLLSSSPSASSSASAPILPVDENILPNVPHLDKLQPPLADKLQTITSLIETRNALIYLNNLHSVVSELEPLIDSDFDKALNLYGDLADLQTRLQSLSQTSSAPIARLLATKGLSHIHASSVQALQKNAQLQFSKFLTESNWPKESSFMAGPQFAKLFTNVLKTSSDAVSVSTQTVLQAQPLVAFELLAESLVLRLKFNFSGSQPTNRLDKPEWLFSFLVSTIDRYFDIINGPVQSLFVAVPRFSDRNALQEFISALLPFVFEKFSIVIPQISKSSPYVYSHVMSELLKFDSLLKDKYYYTPFGVPLSAWRGVTGDLLASDRSWFDTWLAIEKNIALHRYNEILSSPDPFEIDWDSGDPDVDSLYGSCHYTFSSVNVRDLLEGVTNHYNTLHSVSYRLRFLLDIQIFILDTYYSRLDESISAFESMSSSVARAVSGLSVEDAEKISGLKGLETLCRTYGSLQCLCDALETWGQDLFFLELWQDVSRLSSLDDKTKSAVDGVATANIPANEEDEGTLFDETIASYDRLKQRVILNTTNILRKELQSAMKQYFRQSTWKLSSAPSGISSSLTRPIRVLSDLLNYLKRFHSVNQFNKIARSFGSELSRYMWNHIIQANQFSNYGGSQLTIDLTELIATFDLPLDVGIRRLQQACTLLSQGSLPSNTADRAQQLQESLDLNLLSMDEIQSILARRV